ncbi:MAG TPA: hypothetical protein VH255_09650, partial [Verrucomicrobiae bacterium]|nr:hypothetical protein [Verrucomicrobiae bacterium]
MAEALERLNPTPTAFRQVQEDMFGSIKNSFRPENSMQGVLSVPVPQPQQSAPDRHTREMMDRRRNWAFADLSDLYPQPSMEETLGLKEFGTDGKEKKELTAIEKYYENLSSKSTEKRDQLERENELTVLGISKNNASEYGDILKGDSLNPVISAFPDSASVDRDVSAIGIDPNASEKNASAFGP